ncbi:transcriptional regulator [Enterococcus avium]|uniref:helix-turn-helix transcriptional regulator n=1 Tax=Enterococcus malodoratus TaxID=71451 RepID=UPI0008AF8CAA|nr:YafY family protein [Enterococcus malodoratus]BBM18113.1 transcriptional regulator [Enterococcus avium]SET01809.1 Predicted DNA-binding transcriptional regulator YafY, contains an HTH and WYL domains [Enterococcus malodoratus]
MQIERLVRMIFYIVSREQVTAKELADYFNVSTRTIYRDITTLTLSGIPITSKKGTGGGISLMDGYALNKSFLTTEEQVQVYQGLQILQASNYPDAEQALTKIDALFNQSLSDDWLEIDFSYWGSSEEEKITISDLRRALTKKHVLSFEYFNSELQQSERKVDPLRLIFKSHAWYIVGYCHHNHAIRVFRLSRMKRINVLPESFERCLPKDFSLADSTYETDYSTFKLLFLPEMSYRLFDEFQEQQVERCPNGNYLVTVQYPLNEWTYHRLLSFGPYVEILEPAEARKELKRRALKIAQKYD